MKNEMQSLARAAIVGDLRMIRMLLEMNKKDIARQHRDRAVGAAHLAYDLDLFSREERDFLIRHIYEVFDRKAAIAANMG